MGRTVVSPRQRLTDTIADAAESGALQLGRKVSAASYCAAEVYSATPEPPACPTLSAAAHPRHTNPQATLWDCVLHRLVQCLATQQPSSALVAGCSMM